MTGRKNDADIIRYYKLFIDGEEAGCAEVTGSLTFIGERVLGFQQISREKYEELVEEYDGYPKTRLRRTSKTAGSRKKPYTYHTVPDCDSMSGDPLYRD